MSANETTRQGATGPYRISPAYLSSNPGDVWIEGSNHTPICLVGNTLSGKCDPEQIWADAKMIVGALNASAK